MVRTRSPIHCIIVKCVRILLVTIGISLCMAETSDDPNYVGMLQVDSANLKIYYSPVLTDSGENALSIKAVYQGLAWLAIGVNPDGEMIGGETVIGKPNNAVSNVNPGKYDMSDESSSGVVLMDSSAQTLINSSITQDTSAVTTTLMYTKIMKESSELSIDPEGQTTFIWAVGTNNDYPTYHASRGNFMLDLSGVTPVVVGSEESAKNYTKIFAAHGIMAVIAWAFLAPFAIGSAFVRSLLPDPLWFKLHMYLNLSSFVLTLTAFILADVNIDPEERFSEPHFVAGWVIMGLTILQVVAGIFRPHVVTGEKTQSIADVAVRNLNGIMSGSIRAIWEASHKFIGVGTLALALWQMQNGLKLWKENYGTKDYLVPYWIWILILLIGLLVLKIFAARKWSKNVLKEPLEGE